MYPRYLACPGISAEVKPTRKMTIVKQLPQSKAEKWRKINHVQQIQSIYGKDFSFHDNDNDEEIKIMQLA